MLTKRKIRSLIVEDDPIQAEVLKDKLVGLNDTVDVSIFNDGAAMLRYLDHDFKKNKFYFIILDYFLQTEEKKDVLNGFEIVSLLNKKHPKIKVVLHSAYENDDGKSFIKMKEDYPNLIEYVKKSDHAYLIIQNLIYINFIEWELNRKKNRMWIAAIVFGSLSIMAIIHFLTTFYST